MGQYTITQFQFSPSDNQSNGLVEHIREAFRLGCFSCVPNGIKKTPKILLEKNKTLFVLIAVSTFSPTLTRLASVGTHEKWPNLNDSAICSIPQLDLLNPIGSLFCVRWLNRYRNRHVHFFHTNLQVHKNHRH